MRAESGEYWPRLTKEKQRIHWLKVDFSKWKVIYPSAIAII